MRIKIAPGTRWGKWSAGLAAGFVVLFGVFLFVAASGRRGPGFDPVLTAAIVPAVLSGIAAFITGLIAVIRQKGRSVLVFLSIFVGWSVLVFVLGEVLSPG